MVTDNTIARMFLVVCTVVITNLLVFSIRDRCRGIWAGAFASWSFMSSWGC